MVAVAVLEEQSAVEADPDVVTPPGPRRPPWDLIALGVAAGAMAALRFNYVLSGDRDVWHDSHEYAAVAYHNPLLSLGLWAGKEPPLVPLMIKLVPRSPVDFTLLEASIAVVAWTFL